ncbi:alpha/beta hydrolase [Glutamicibacter protophormiae]|uniref:alpha/beta fold hydrolase n=1 Tax=Glutamicibacter protophormiae TaxID=37930 RepID=UPI002A82C1BA|nr:alpha/beta hydrolase [Glutamicibacter protophormiae]WPR63535.1 alpha/beta hydrolase [Glutamicibacter protophormiae]WPR67030.1 alpha/beta hydrolase [Glutamicibacter protophormiae]
MNQHHIDGVQKVAGQGIPLVLIHGHGVDHRILLALDEVLAATGIFQRIYVDLPGMGQTAGLKGAGGLPEIADWLEALIRRQCGQRPFAMVGNSLGSLLAQEMGDRFGEQVAGIAMLAPLVFPLHAQRTVPPREILHSDPSLLAGLPLQDAEHYEKMSVLQTVENWQRFSIHVLPGIRSVNLRSMVKLSKRYFLDELPVERAGTLDCPVLMLCGQQDHVTGFADPRKLAARYPSAEITVVPSAGHNVHLDQPDIVAGEMTRWSRAVLAYSGK